MKWNSQQNKIQNEISKTKDFASKLYARQSKIKPSITNNINIQKNSGEKLCFRLKCNVTDKPFLKFHIVDHSKTKTKKTAREKKN